MMKLHNILTVLPLSALVATTAVFADAGTSKGELLMRSCESVASIEPNVLPITLKASTGESSYKVGENLKLYLSADQDAIITIFDKGTESGRNKVLYENQEISANKPLVLPEAGWALPVSGPVGKNVLEVHVFPKTDDGLGKNVDKVRIPVEQPNPVISCQLTFEVKPN